MTLHSLSAVAVTSRIARAAAPALIPALTDVEKSVPSAGYDPRIGASEAMAAAVFSARAQFDSRVTGPTESVTRFDRMALVIEGFEHLRDVIDGLSQQAAENFGQDGANAPEEATAPTTYGSLDLRM